MPNPCQYGAVPAAGAPPYFQFTQADLTAAMGSWSSEVSLDLLGISPRPYETTAFVASPPDWDFPIATDYASLTIPTLAALNGAYQRFKNLILANKWASLAVCNPAPSTNPSDHTFQSGYVSGDTSTASLVAWVGPHLSRLSTMTAHVLGYTGQPTVFYVALSRNPLTVGQSWGFSGDRGIFGLGPYQISSSGAAFNFPMGGWTNYTNLYPAVLIDGYGGPSTVDIEWTFTDHLAPASPPDPPPAVTEPPTGFPAPVAPPACTTDSICASLAAITNKLEAMDSRIQHTNAALAPPGVVADTAPVLANPVDPTHPPGTPDVPLLPILKPVEAVGAVIQCTTVPDSLARYGTDPLYFPFLLHAVPITDLGPMEGVRVTRNPQVVLNLPAQVTSLALDPAPGVVAQVQWVRAPK